MTTISKKTHSRKEYSQKARSAKTQALHDRLIDMAHRLGPQAKLPTAVELREMLGTSSATLNTVLKELEAHSVIYRRHAVGIFVSPALHRKSIALVCDSQTLRNVGHSPFWDMLVDFSRERADAHNENFSLHLTTTPDIEGNALQESLKKEIGAGCINGVLGISLNKASIEWIVQQNVPFVGFASSGPHTAAVDSGLIISQGVAYLKHAGCRRIALWMPEEQGDTPKFSFLTPRKKTRLFRWALKSNGLHYNEDHVYSPHFLQPDSIALQRSRQEHGYDAAYHFFGKYRVGDALPIDGLIITDDMMAQGALTALQKLKVPFGHSTRELRVVSHSNVGSTVLLGHNERLIFSKIDPREVVQAMFGRLEQVMAGENPPHKRITIRSQLVF